MDYLAVLRRLSFNDEYLGDTEEGITELPPKTLALVQLAALIAVGGAEASFGAAADAAISAGASADEVVAVLIGVVPIVGTPRAVAASPELALALGHDLDELDALGYFAPHR